MVQFNPSVPRFGMATSDAAKQAVSRYRAAEAEAKEAKLDQAVVDNFYKQVGILERAQHDKSWTPGERLNQLNVVFYARPGKRDSQVVATASKSLQSFVKGLSKSEALDALDAYGNNTKYPTKLAREIETALLDRASGGDISRSHPDEYSPRETRRYGEVDGIVFSYEEYSPETRPSYRTLREATLAEDAYYAARAEALGPNYYYPGHYRGCSCYACESGYFPEVRPSHSVDAYLSPR